MDQEIRPLITKNPQAVSPGTALTRVLSLMLKTGYKSFSVVDNDRVVGMVAREDVIGALRRAANLSPGSSHQGRGKYNEAK